MTGLRRFLTWRPVLTGVALLAFMILGSLGLDGFWLRQVILVCSYTLVVSGLNLSLGYAGELALGQGAIFAAGAYITASMATHGHNDLLLSLVLSMVAAVVVGVVSGAPGLRLGGWALAMVSFFLVLIVPDIAGIFSSVTGGYIGIAAIPAPAVFGYSLDQRNFFLVSVGLVALWLLLLRNLVTSRHGVAFRVLRESPILAASVGISVPRMKLLAYALGSLPAGLAGSIFAYEVGFISPNSFGFDLVVGFLAASILGGAESLLGAVVGSAILVVAPIEITAFQKYSLIVYGVFLVIGGVLSGVSGGRLRRLVVAKVTELARTRWPGLFIASPPASQPASAQAGSRLEPDLIPGAELVVEGVTKSFGGMAALRGADIRALPGQVTALIGPNGSGKTTLLNVVSGFYRPESGRVLLDGEPIDGLRAADIARLGVVRTFQTPIIPRSLTVAEAVTAGRYRHPYAPVGPAVARTAAYRRAADEDARATRQSLDDLGLAGVAEQTAASLPLGERRLLELARTLVGKPRVLLLDETASGLDEHEVRSLATLLRDLCARGATIVLIEHNFDLVSQVADVVFVLADGAVIAHGSASEVAKDPQVLLHYLGSRSLAAAEQEVALLEASEERS